MTKFIIVRHGHVEGIKPERFRGRADLPLTQLGLAQADAVARKIAAAWAPVGVYTSPLKRCVQTGEKIANACGIKCLQSESLCDIDYGTWQSRTYTEAERTDPALFRAWFSAPHLVRFPQGESLQAVVARTADAYRAALRDHANGVVIFVGHDSVNRALLLQFADQPLSAYWRFEQSPCCINEVDVTFERIAIRRINDVCHLDRVG